MDNVELLKRSRDLLLRLHKSLVDFERDRHEQFHGAMTSGQFLNLLLNDEDFEWLRKFSMLIVEIDEMFDLDEGYPQEMVDAHLVKMRNLLALRDEEDVYFTAKYQFALQNEPSIAIQHAEIKTLLGK